ncbi:MAG: hypothetical protein ACREB3_09090, partial [Burkholderiales bacterium]
MSRIHDALKKAEQERAGSPRPDMGPKPSAVGPPPVAVEEGEHPAVAKEGMVPPVVESAPYSGP